MSTPLQFDWTVNVGQIVNLGVWFVLVVFLGAKFWYIFKEHPPHKHVVGGRIARSIAKRDWIEYPKGMGPKDGDH